MGDVIMNILGYTTLITVLLTSVTLFNFLFKTCFSDYANQYLTKWFVILNLTLVTIVTVMEHFELVFNINNNLIFCFNSLKDLLSAIELPLVFVIVVEMFENKKHLSL